MILLYNNGEEELQPSQDLNFCFFFSGASTSKSYAKSRMQGLSAVLLSLLHLRWERLYPSCPPHLIGLKECVSKIKCLRDQNLDPNLTKNTTQNIKKFNIRKLQLCYNLKGKPQKKSSINGQVIKKGGRGGVKGCAIEEKKLFF